MVSNTVMEVRYRILQSREEIYLVMNRMLLTNTESKTRIIFSIKNLIQFFLENRLGLLWEKISRFLNAPTAQRH